MHPIRARAHSPWRLAAALLIAALFLTNIYRAVTQSITHDEALIYEWYLSGPWSDLVNFEHGNHHVLADILSKLSITILGVSEVALRIPTLLSGLLYFYSIYALSRLLFGEGALLFLSVALLSLNPFVLDYLVLSRGYGLGLGFFFYALFQLVRYLVRQPEAEGDTGPRWMLWRAGLALGLSIGSNIIMIFPAGALVFCTLCLYLREKSLVQAQPVAKAKKHTGTKPKVRKRPSSDEAAAEPTPARPLRGWWPVVLRFVIPTALVGGAISLIPKQLLEIDPNYPGPPSFLAAVEPLVRNSYIHSAAGFPGFAAIVPPDAIVWAITLAVLPLLLAALLAVAIRVAPAFLKARSVDPLPPVDRFLLLLAGLFPVLLGMIFVSHFGFKQPYPELRTFAYCLPLLSFAALGLLTRFSGGEAIQRGLSAAMAVAVILTVIQFATQFNTRYFAEWAYCAAGKDMMQALVNEHQGNPNARVKLGVTWQLEPVANFYRMAWGLTWMNPVDRRSPDGDFDYVMLGFADTPLVNFRPLRPLMRDELSGTLLAKRFD